MKLFKKAKRKPIAKFGVKVTPNTPKTKASLKGTIAKKRKRVVAKKPTIKNEKAAYAVAVKEVETRRFPGSCSKLHKPKPRAIPKIALKTAPARTSPVKTTSPRPNTPKVAKNAPKRNTGAQTATVRRKTQAKKTIATKTVAKKAKNKKAIAPKAVPRKTVPKTKKGGN